ncbi:MAG: hypothetical protein RKO66_20405 [Candidatus Contendobacter sp.]|nr:hypothetical protein [Candidatus Contendobacter sp.]MDS4058177.1 hypothetical protein [Candidatus Contendobacter sp.]
MNGNKQLKLLAALLAIQEDALAPTAAADACDEVHWQEALTRKSALRGNARKALLHSPQTRRQFYFMADVTRAEAYARWKQAGIETALRYRAAASPTVEPLKIESNPHFTLILFPLDDEGKTWNLYLKLSAAFRPLASAGIRLVDDRGEVWLAGQPDADGELSSDWQLEGSPLERLLQHQLQIQPG